MAISRNPYEVTVMRCDNCGEKQVIDTRENRFAFRDWAVFQLTATDSSGAFNKPHTTYEPVVFCLKCANILVQLAGRSVAKYDYTQRV